MRKLTEKDVEFRIEWGYEELPVRGNASALDNPAMDRVIEDNIIHELESGNEWAWCCARVVASWSDYEGDAYLGCVSCKSEEDFKSNSGSYEDLKIEALENLNRSLAHMLAEARRVEKALEILA